MIHGARATRFTKPTPTQEPPAEETNSAGINPLWHALATSSISAPAADGTGSEEPNAPAGPPNPLGRADDGDGLGADPMPRNLQMKLTAGPPDDPLEQEADRAAAGAASGSGIYAASTAAPTVSLASFRAGGGQAGDGSMAARIKSPSGGRPLPDPLRNDMETMFNADFSAVRVHDSQQDRTDAERLGARAFTHKHDIWLGENGNVQDRGLLAHELTHVIQQGTDVRRKTPDQTDPQLNTAGEREAQATVTTGETPDIQAAWYNFRIPFTDYEFDPSISGIKTAAGVVKDAAVDSAVWVKDQVVAGLEWVFERIKDLVNDGIDWLEGKYTEIKEFAKSSFDTINNGLQALLEHITSPAELLTNAVRLMSTGLLGTAWNLLKSGVTLVWNGIKTTINSVLSIGTGLWETVSGFVSGLFDTLDGIFDSWAFEQLPESVRSAARWLFNKVRALWEEIRDFVTGLLRRLREYADIVVGAIEGFAKNVVSFSIDAVIGAVQWIAETWEFIKTAAADPIGYIRPHTDKLAAQLNAEAPPKAIKLGSEKLEENFRREPTGAGPDIVVQRQPEPSKPERSVAGWDEVKNGFTKAIRDAWDQLDIGQMLLDTIVNLFWPPATIRAIGHEFSELWSTDWTNAAAGFFAPRWPFDSWAAFAGFWHDIWSNLLVALDFPLALSRRLTNVLMLLTGYATIILIILGAVAGGLLAGPPGAAAGALLGLEVASSVGLLLLKAYLLTEGLSFVKAAIDLFTARQTQPEKNRDYKQMAGSSLGIAVALILVAILWFLSTLVDGLISIIKGRKAPAVTTGGEGAPPPPAAKVKPGEAPKVEPPKEPAETPSPPAETPSPPAETPSPRMQEPIREMESGQPIEFGPRHAEALRQNAEAATAKWLKMLETQGRVPWPSIRNQMRLSRWRFLPEAPEAAAILRDALNRLPAGPERAEMLGMLDRWMKGAPEPAAPAVRGAEPEVTPPTEAVPRPTEPKTRAPEPAEQVKPGEAPKVEPPKEPAAPAEETKPGAPKEPEPVEPVPATPNTFKVKPSALEATKPSRFLGIKNVGFWHWKLIVRLPTGETVVWCEINIRFRGSPDLNLDVKNAKVLGTSKTVSLKADGFSWTTKALEMMIETYKKEFGHAPKNLGGWLAKDNLLNFQRAFAEIRAANPGMSMQEVAQAAVKQISFGKARVAIGYEHFHVTILRTGKVPKVTLPDGTTPTVPTSVRVEAGTSPIELGKTPWGLIPQVEGEGESAGEEEEEE